MTRPLPAERQREADEILRYMEFFERNVWRKAAASIRSAHAEIVSRFGESKALQGLRQAANDTIEQYGHKPAEVIAALDAALRENQVITFTQVRVRYSATYKRILKRGAIRSETEYYLAAGILADLSTEIPAEERTRLVSLVGTYIGDA